jgi:hypothetical protein
MTLLNCDTKAKETKCGVLGYYHLFVRPTELFLACTQKESEGGKPTCSAEVYFRF